MNEVKRYDITTDGFDNFSIDEDKLGRFVLLEDYAELQQQLAATTNSLTNAQEALKSAGIEADTVQAGVMELVSKLAELEQKKILLEQGCENSPLLHEMLDWKERAEAAELKLRYRNEMRADGMEDAINILKALDASPFAIHALECRLYELRAGNAGKDDWIDWDGGDCPVGMADIVECKKKSGDISKNVAVLLAWEHLGYSGDIIAYRVIKDGSH